MADPLEQFESLLTPTEDVIYLTTVAEEEIRAAQKRHPDRRDQAYHSFGLLVPTHDRMATEFVYRSHARELLERVAASEDTRLGTAAEACCTLADVARATPFRSSAAGLYMRMWRLAGFPTIEEFDRAGQHHEALESEVIDDHESQLRRRLAQPRSFNEAKIACRGRHHGQPVDCAYHT